MANDLIKRANADSEFTPESMKELDRCSKDPVYFIRKYVKIQHPTDGTVPFDLFDYQEEIIDLIHNNKDSLILASRQLGKCVCFSSLINISKRPSFVKKFILYFINRELYDSIKNL